MSNHDRKIEGTFPLRILLLCLASISILQGCAFLRILSGSHLKKPSFDYVDYDVAGMDETRAELYFHLKAKNPNGIGLKNVFVSYELFSEGKRFLRGDSIAVELAPNGATPLLVPAQVVYIEALRALGPAAKKVARGARTLPVTVYVTLTGKPTVYNEIEEGSLFSFSLKLNRTIDVPIPREAAKQAAERGIRKSIRKMF